MHKIKIIIFLYIFSITTIFLQATPILVRFHYVKYLSKSTYLLSLLHKQNYNYKPCNCIKNAECVQIDSTLFFHHKVQLCIQKMMRTGSLKSMLLLLHEVKNYSYVHDNQFFHELFLLIFTVHKQILVRECEENQHALKKSTLETIIQISDKINQLPIAEVLNAIDMLVTELPPFLEKYEFHSKITWKIWLKKYWWVPPVFGIWFGLKILLSLQRPHYYFSPYLSPRPTIPLQPIITNDPVLAEIIIENK